MGTKTKDNAVYLCKLNNFNLTIILSLTIETEISKAARESSHPFVSNNNLSVCSPRITLFHTNL